MTVTSKRETLDGVLGGLMRRYRERVPDVEKIIRAMTRDGLIGGASDLENDHIAFRTMGVPQLGVASLEKIFLHLGYERRDPYDFPGKKLSAFWYSPPPNRATRASSSANCASASFQTGRSALSARTPTRSRATLLTRSS